MIPSFRCPTCGALSDLRISVRQAICTNHDCRMFTFDPSATDGGLSGVHTIELPPMEG